MDYIKIIASIATDIQTGDYEQDGLVMCGKCHTPKQCVMEIRGELCKLPIMCKCRKRMVQEKEERRKQIEHDVFINHLRADGMPDALNCSSTFTADDRRNKKVSDVCRKYIDSWGDMLKENMGILFFGTVGTGKSFYASCVANALIDRGTPAGVTNTARILNDLQGMFDGRQEYIEDLQRFKLLVIDDLGAERSSSYAAELVYNIIDARACTKLPLVVTTNLTLAEMMRPESLQYKRIYDRVLEMCPIRIEMHGDSRRIESAERKRRLAKDILGERQ